MRPQKIETEHPAIGNPPRGLDSPPILLPYPSATRIVAATGRAAESGLGGHALSGMLPSTPLVDPLLAKPVQMVYPALHYIHLRYTYSFYGMTRMDWYK